MFGFVVVVMFFDDEVDVICLVNDMVYGFVGFVWMENLGCVVCVVWGVCSGVFLVNFYFLVCYVMFFGGMKVFGFGCEFGLDVVEYFIEIKNVFFVIDDF